MFESGAILIYLAEKTGRFLSTEPRARSTQLQWVIWQMAGLGPMHGQAHHFARYAPEPVDAYAQQRFTREAERLLFVMNRRLGEAAYLGGDDYSIADMCSWPWINQMNVIPLDRADFPNVNRWFETVAARPGVIEGCRFELPKLMKEPGRIPLTADQFSRGFGDIMHAANRVDWIEGTRQPAGHSETRQRRVGLVFRLLHRRRRRRSTSRLILLRSRFATMIWRRRDSPAPRSVRPWSRWRAASWI